jgi:hypothetical protein
LRNVLFLLDHLRPHGAAKQLALAAPALASAGVTVHALALGPTGPFAPILEAAGFPVEALGWQRWLDLPAVFELRQRIRQLRPDAIHVCGPVGLGLLGWPGLRDGRPLICEVSLEALESGRWVDAWRRQVLQRTGALIVPDMSAMKYALQLGLKDKQLPCIGPAVAPMPDLPPPADIAGLRYLACVGPFDAHKGHRDAIWAFDILRHAVPGIHLVMIGEGPERHRLETFKNEAGMSDVVRFLGWRDDALALIAHAEIVWVPSVGRGGINAALEAQAAGRPVVAANIPALAAVVEDGKTGLLYPPGVQGELARVSRRLLEDEALRTRFGKAGRERVAQSFTVGERVRHLAGVYNSVLGKAAEPVLGGAE